MFLHSVMCFAHMPVFTQPVWQDLVMYFDVASSRR